MEIRCLGKFSLLTDGRHFPLPQTKSAELLAYLACEMGGPVSKRRLAEALWPAAEPEQALDCLYKACRPIRNTPFASHILSSRGEMRLDMVGVRCDLADFRRHYAARNDIARCEAAVALYRGALLGENFYEWSNAWEAYYDIRYLEVLTLLADHYDRIGDKAKAAYYRRKLDEHAADGR